LPSATISLSRWPGANPSAMCSASERRKGCIPSSFTGRSSPRYGVAVKKKSWPPRSRQTATICDRPSAEAWWASSMNRALPERSSGRCLASWRFRAAWVQAKA